MKRICITFATAIILLISTLPLKAQFSTTGKDFWLSFGNNYGYPSDSLSLQIRIVTTKPTQVTISFTQQTPTVIAPISVSLKADTVFTYDLTSTQKQAACHNTAGAATMTTSKSIHIQTDENVSVFAINLHEYTTDATTILPTPSLGTSYWHLGYNPPSNAYPDGYTVIAMENSTTIYENGAVRATLNKGQVYSSYFASDGSGKHITASKSIAYFVTHSGVNIPTSYGNVDCLYAQLYPEISWGNNFFIPVTIRGKERVRIVASQNATSINITGGYTTAGTLISTPQTLNAGQWMEMEVRTTQNGCYVRSTKPVGVATYLTGLSYSIIYKQGLAGDPSLTWVPPIEQSITESLLAPFLQAGSSVLKEHYFIIVTPTSAKNLTQISINGGTFTGLSGGTWYDHSSGYSYYNTDSLSTTANVTYKLKNSQGLIVFGYGLGNRESYYYVAGSAIHKLDAYFEVDSIHFQQLNNTTLCYDSVNVKAIVRYTMNVQPGYLRWFVDSVEQPPITDSLLWSKRFSLGKHTISMIATDQFGTKDTMITSFVVAQKESVTIYDTICRYDSVSVGQKYYKTTGTYKDTLQTVWGCDSVVTLHLVVKDTSLTKISASICEGKTYTDNDFNETQAGIYTKKLKSVFGCDSTVILTLTVNTKDTTFIAVSICKGDTYTDAHFTNLTLEGVYYDTLKNKNGCDTILELTLGYYPNVPITQYADTLCFGKIYNDANFTNLTIAGTYYDTLKNKNGCDSIIQLDLVYYPQIPITQYTDTLCSGKTYNDANFKNLRITGIYYDTLKNINGCDSILELNLNFYLQNPITTYSDTICYGLTYNDDNFTNLTTAGTYYDTLKNVNDCDSIIEIHLDFYPQVPVTTYSDTICYGLTYNDDNFTNLTTAGTYYDTLKNVNDCDSIIEFTLVAIEKDTFEIFDTICEGETYQQNGFNCSETDTYFQYLQTVLGCDSTVILNLYVANKDTNFIFDTICQEETYNQNGFISSETGVYFQNLQNHYGCDSLVVLDLTVSPIPDVEIVPVTDNFCYEHFVELQVITNGDNILWSTGETENPITVTAIATYFATAYIGYCENTASYTVGECPCYVWLPNSFTPNGDGLNEVYKPEIVCPGGFKDYKLIIYDRWGNRVFQSFDYAVGWDGTDGKGKTYSDGSYSCVLEYTDSKNKRIMKNTAVTVFR